MAIRVDEENAFCLTKIGDLTPDTEPISKIDSWVLLQFFPPVICQNKCFILVVVVGGGVGNWGDCCSGAAE